MKTVFDFIKGMIPKNRLVWS